MKKMALTKGEVTIAVCDACGNRKYAESPLQPLGVSGHATLIEGEVTQIEKNIKYFSCRTDAGHVGKAIRAALDRYVGPAPR